MRRWEGQQIAAAAAVKLILGHGASGTAAPMHPWVEALRSRGAEARAIDLPRAPTKVKDPFEAIYEP